MLETVSLLYEWMRDLAAYVVGSWTLLNCWSSLRVAIVASFGCEVLRGVCCAATDKAPVQAVEKVELGEVQLDDVWSKVWKWMDFIVVEKVEAFALLIRKARGSHVRC